VKIYIMKPEHAKGILPVLFFIHGGVWIAGNFENQQALRPRSGLGLKHDSSLPRVTRPSPTRSFRRKSKNAMRP